MSAQDISLVSEPNWKSQLRRHLGLQKKKISTLAGLEPAIPWFVVRCLIRWATGPLPLQCLEMSSLMPENSAPVAIWLVGLGVCTLINSHCRDSSVGRALDWRSKGPRFDPGSRQVFDLDFCEHKNICHILDRHAQGHGMCSEKPWCTQKAFTSIIVLERTVQKCLQHRVFPGGHPSKY